MSEVNGTTLYYEIAGDDFPILFIHGMCGNAGVWADQVARLSPHFKCIAYDRRGHTRSPLGEIAVRTVELHADDAAALIRKLQIAPCLLVGPSGGARVGIDVVRRHSALLRGAVLSEPPLFALDPEGAAAFVAELKPRLEHAVAAGNGCAAVDAFFEMVCPGLWHTLPDAARAPYRANHSSCSGTFKCLRTEYHRTLWQPSVVPVWSSAGSGVTPCSAGSRTSWPKSFPVAAL